MIERFWVVFIWLNIIHTGYCQDFVNSEKKSYDGVFGKTLNLKWDINLNEDDSIYFANLYHGINIDSDKKLFSSRYFSEPKPEGYAKKVFGNRISASLSALSYEVTIYDLKYDDSTKESGSFLLVILVEGYQRKESIITIDKVVGGPDICGPDIPATITYKELDTPDIIMTLCGVPEPSATFQFITNENKRPAVEKINHHTYKYTLELPTISQTMCNKQVLFQAVGFNGKRIERRSIVSLNEFKPTEPENVHFFRVENCIQVTWEPIDTGNCKVIYTLNFFNGSVFVGNDVLVEHDSFYTCASQYLDATSVIVFASYKGQKGHKSRPSKLVTNSTWTTNNEKFNKMLKTMLEEKSQRVKIRTGTAGETEKGLLTNRKIAKESDQSDVTADVVGTFGVILLLMLVSKPVFYCIKKRNLFASIISQKDIEETEYPVYDVIQPSKENHKNSKKVHCYETTDFVQIPEAAKNYMVLGPARGPKRERRSSPASSHYREAKENLGNFRQDNFGNSVSNVVLV